MKTKKNCVDCDQLISKDEAALSRKLLGKDTIDLYCITCLATLIECDIDDLEVKLQEFKEQGCTLFL